MTLLQRVWAAVRGFGVAAWDVAARLFWRVWDGVFRLPRRVQALEDELRNTTGSANFARSDMYHADQTAHRALDEVRTLKREVDEWTHRFEIEVARQIGVDVNKEPVA